MSTIQLKAYDAGSSILTTELNALANGSSSAASAAVDNSSTLNLFDDLELTVTYGTNPTANAPVEIYLIPSTDGTNYADSTTPARNLFVGSFLVQASTSAQRLVLRGIPLPPGKFKYVAKNASGFAFPATGTVVKRTPYSHQVT
jgi:hypothetical protein